MIISPNPHNHKHNFLHTLQKNVTPSSLFVTMLTLWAVPNFTSIINSIDSRQDPSLFKETLNYVLQLSFNIFSWNLLNNFVPKVDWKMRFNNPEKSLLAKNNYQYLKTLKENFSKMDYKHLGAIVGIFTFMEGLTHWFKEHTFKDNQFAQNITVLAGFIVKLFSVYKLDTIFQNKTNGFAGFIQSLLESCECCGNPQLLCIQMMPVYFDIWNKSGHGLTNTMKNN